MSSVPSSEDSAASAGAKPSVVDLVPDNVGEYRKKEYWDWRYEREAEQATTYEWFKGYAYFREELRRLLQSTDHILILGCGNSRLTEELWEDGFRCGIVNIDYSPAVIAMMSARMPAQLYPSVSWHCLDFRSMASELPAASFDVVLDKGSLDAVWSDGGSQWTPSPEVLVDISATIGEIVQLLRPGGRFISISFGQPHFRLPFMLQGHEMQWGLQEQPVQLGLYYIYVFVKK